MPGTGGRILSAEFLKALPTLRLQNGEAGAFVILHLDMTDPTEYRHATVAAAWGVIVTYPVTARPREVAANLTLDTLSREEVHSRTAAAARNWVKSEVGTWDDCAGRYAGAYRELIGERRHESR